MEKVNIKCNDEDSSIPGEFSGGILSCNYFLYDDEVFEIIFTDGQRLNYKVLDGKKVGEDSFVYEVKRV